MPPNCCAACRAHPSRRALDVLFLRSSRHMSGAGVGEDEEEEEEEEEEEDPASET